jgi:hypothetical protein
VPSTILDLTGTIPRLLREGAIPVDRLRKVASVITEGTPYRAPAPVAAADVVAVGDVDDVAEVSEVADVDDVAEKPALPHPMAFPVAPPAADYSGAGTDEPPSAGEPVS